MRCCRSERFEDETELKHLAEMLWYADQAYEGESEKTLSQRLGKKGMDGALMSGHSLHSHCKRLLFVFCLCFAASCTGHWAQEEAA